VCRELGDCAGPEWVDVLFSVVVGGIAASPVFGVALLGRRLKGCVMSKAGAQHAVGGKKPSRWMIGIFALGYFLVSLVLLVFLIGMGMAEFDSPDPPSLVLRLAGVAMLVELLPLVTPVLLLHIHLPIVAQWLVFFGNSLLWGWGAWYLLGRFRRRTAT
jgi:hypothetical protein